MDTDGQSHQVGDEYKPAVGVWLISHFLPLEDSPEHDSREQRRRCVNLALDSREPERVAPSVSQGSNHSCAHDRHELAEAVVALGVRSYNLLGEQRNGPEQEKNRECAGKSRHRVHHKRHMLHIACEKSEEVAHEHKERSPWRMAYVKLVGCGNELWAVPETCSWLHCAEICECGDSERQPSEYPVP